MLSTIQLKYFAQRGRDCRTAAIRATDPETRRCLNDLAAAYECLYIEAGSGDPFPNARLQAAAFAVLEAELPRDTPEGRSMAPPIPSRLPSYDQRAMRNALDRWTNESGSPSR
ncbi:hypothetical protein GCM10009087_47790 [Sphingomonas oligophenolica]